MSMACMFKFSSSTSALPKKVSDSYSHGQQGRDLPDPINNEVQPHQDALKYWWAAQEKASPCLAILI